MTAFVFLDKDVIELTVSPKDLEAVTRRVAAGEMTKNELVPWMQKPIGRVRGQFPTGHTTVFIRFNLSPVVYCPHCARVAVALAPALS